MRSINLRIRLLVGLWRLLGLVLRIATIHVRPRFEPEFLVVLLHLPLERFDCLEVLLAPLMAVPGGLAPEALPARDALPLLLVLALRGGPVEVRVVGATAGLLPFLLDEYGLRGGRGGCGGFGRAGALGCGLALRLLG